MTLRVRADAHFPALPATSEEHQISLRSPSGREDQRHMGCGFRKPPLIVETKSTRAGIHTRVRPTATVQDTQGSSRWIRSEFRWFHPERIS